MKTTEPRLKFKSADTLNFSAPVQIPIIIFMKVQVHWLLPPICPFILIKHDLFVGYCSSIQLPITESRTDTGIILIQITLKLSSHLTYYHPSYSSQDGARPETPIFSSRRPTTCHETRHRTSWLWTSTQRPMHTVWQLSFPIRQNPTQRMYRGFPR